MFETCGLLAPGTRTTSKHRLLKIHAMRDLPWSDVPAGIAKLRVVKVGCGAT